MPSQTRNRVTLAISLGALCLAVFWGRREIPLWLRGTFVVTSIAPQQPPQAPVPPTVTAKIDVIGQAPIWHFVVDQTATDRLVSCEHVSEDGGKSWRPLVGSDGQRAFALGGRHARPPTLSHGRMACADVILQRGSVPDGLAPIHAAAEWDGNRWFSADLASPSDASTPSIDPVAGLAYQANGSLVAASGRYFLRRGAAIDASGQVRTFAFDSAGRLYAALQSGTQRPTLMWADSARGPWSSIESPGEVRLLTSHAEGTVAVADMLGYGSGGSFHWTRWPVDVPIDGLTAHGTTFVAWGGSWMTVSRNNGRTLQVVHVPGVRLAWVVVDPRAASGFFALDSDRRLLRIVVGGLM